MCIGLNVTEVAHDIQQQVSRFITSDLSLVNSYDTWHGTCISMYCTCQYLMHRHVLGTKNVWKQLQKVTQGRVRDRGVTWFPELVDKSECIYTCTMYMCIAQYLIGKSIKTHLYWAMKNCQKSAENLRRLIDNIPAHYQVSMFYPLHTCT